MVDRVPQPAGSPPADERLRGAAPAYADLEAKRARAGIAAALFGTDDDDAERLTVGRYRIDSRLGAGGMGVVFRAHDPDLERPVAVKLLHNESSTDERARARMLREARALAKLSHPNVIAVYDVGTDDGQVFVAMELVAGLDLRRWLDARRDASWRRALELFVAAGRGLAAAHEVGLIHRDFKPENVLVGDDGRVRVLDFGLARAHEGVATGQTGDGPLPVSASVVATDGDGVDPADVARLPTAAFSGGLTETGALIGTPLYMAPELYAGRPADVRSDQFAFCASLYEGLYRQLPFGSRNLASHVEAVRAGRIVAPPADSPVPASLWRVIERGLAVEPDARWPDMGTLLRELERLAREPAQTELPQPRGGSRSLVIAGLVAAAAVGFVGLELGWFSGDNAGSVAAATPGVVAEPEPEPEPREPEPREPEPRELEPPELAPQELVELPASEIGAGESETEIETGAETEATPVESEAATTPAVNPSGFCHLHEDRYTLLDRSSRRRASFVHQGVCYTCRVESRRSRTRSFSPRDCAGYSLCGEASAAACE